MRKFPFTTATSCKGANNIQIISKEAHGSSEWKHVWDYKTWIFVKAHHELCTHTHTHSQKAQQTFEWNMKLSFTTILPAILLVALLCIFPCLLFHCHYPFTNAPTDVFPHSFFIFIRGRHTFSDLFPSFDSIELFLQQRMRIYIKYSAVFSTSVFYQRQNFCVLFKRAISLPPPLYLQFHNIPGSGVRNSSKKNGK